MASSSMLIRSVVYSSRRSLFSATCNCVASEGSVNFKGKNRAYLHSSRRVNEEQQGQQSTSTATAVPDSALPETLETMPLGAEEVPILAEPANATGESGMSKEMFEVAERRRRMLLSKSPRPVAMSVPSHYMLNTSSQLAVKELESIGSSQTRENTWQPHHSFTRTKTAQSVTVSHLLAASAHLGHSKALSNPMAFPHIYGTRHGVSVIDMRETLTALRRAAALVKATVENDGIVLFVGNKNMKDSERVLEANASKMGRNGYATSRWLPGTLTNASTLFAASKNMIKDADINPTSFHPSLIVLFAPLSTPHTLREANAVNIPTIALCDSNVDPRHFTYPIPCNDDSLRVVELISGVLAEAGKQGAKNRDAKQKQVQASTQDLEREYQAQQKSLYEHRQQRLR